MGKRTTYVFAGGGSGGHLFPGLAVAAELRARDERAEIVFIGSERGIERDIVRGNGYRHEPLPVEPSTMLRTNPVKYLWRNWHARAQAARLLGEAPPAAVVGLGGFASVPVVLAASSQNIPALLLEQNIVPGRATRWLSGRASLVCLSFDRLHGRLSSRTPTCVTGNPVARQVAELHNRPRRAGRQSVPSLLILGGSQGATAVNEMVLAAIERLHRSKPEAQAKGQSKPEAQAKGPPGRDPSFACASGFDSHRRPRVAPLADWTIAHQTGAAQHDEVARRYAALGLPAETAPFFSDMPARYARAALAITRAGATSLAELAVAGVPAIIVPYPNSLGDHQRLNARYYEARGAARIVEQHGGSIDALTRIVLELTADAARRRTMGDAVHALAKPHAAAEVADRLHELIAGPPVAQRRSA